MRCGGSTVRNLRVKGRCNNIVGLEVRREQDRCRREQDGCRGERKTGVEESKAGVEERARQVKRRELKRCRRVNDTVEEIMRVILRLTNVNYGRL